MRLGFAAFVLVAGVFGLTACATKYDQAERDRNYATFMSIAKVGLRFEDVRAQLAAKQLKCYEPVDETGRGKDRVSFVSLANGFPRMATFKESTGWSWLPNGPSTYGVIRMDNAGVITAVQ